MGDGGEEEGWGEGWKRRPWRQWVRGGGGGGGLTDVELLALGSRRELAIANCCAKLLAKYVSPCHIRLLRGRFMVSRNAVSALK